MKLTNAQRRALSYYQRMHGTQPTMLSLIAPVWWHYLLVVVLVGIAVLVLPIVLIYLGTGVLLGIVVRDLMRYRELVRTWPVFEAILDWDTIEALLAEDQLQIIPEYCALARIST